MSQVPAALARPSSNFTSGEVPTHDPEKHKGRGPGLCLIHRFRPQRAKQQASFSQHTRSRPGLRPAQPAAQQNETALYASHSGTPRGPRRRPRCAAAPTLLHRVRVHGAAPRAARGSHRRLGAGVDRGDRLGGHSVGLGGAPPRAAANENGANENGATVIRKRGTTWTARARARRGALLLRHR